MKGSVEDITGQSYGRMGLQTGGKDNVGQDPETISNRPLTFGFDF